MYEKTASAIRFRTLDLAYAALFAALIAVCAWISIPMTVPFTLQTFGIFAALCTLGGRRGTYAVAVYLLLGAVGLPVFAGFSGGPGVLLGTTGGYITGFLAAGLLYWILTSLLGNRIPVKILSCVLGMAVYYVLGTAWFLAVYNRTVGSIGLQGALTFCVFPFLAPDLAKIGLAILVSRRVERLLK